MIWEWRLRWRCILNFDVPLMMWLTALVNMIEYFVWYLSHADPVHFRVRLSQAVPPPNSTYQLMAQFHHPDIRSLGPNVMYHCLLGRLLA